MRIENAKLCAKRTELDNNNDENATGDRFEDQTSSVAEKEAWESDAPSTTSAEDNNSAASPGCLTNPLYEEYMAWRKSLSSAQAVLDKKIQSLQRELDKAEQMEDTVARANLLTANLYLFTTGVRTTTVQNWERATDDGEPATIDIAIDEKYQSASEEADALYQQARKLKRGAKIVSELLQMSEQAAETLEELALDLDAVVADDGSGAAAVHEDMLRLMQERLTRTSSMTGFSAPPDASSSSRRRHQSANSRSRKPEIGTPASNLRKISSPSGCIVLVGRNRQGNEHLSLNLAKGDDVWMHARGCPGAHVVVQQRRGSPPALEEDLQFAANVAIFYSDARNERRAEVTLTAPKHLRKPRGAPLGAVKLRVETRVMVGFPAEVPTELQKARDQSGQNKVAFYRRQDKAKNRKWTRETAKEQQKKQKKRQQKS